MNQTSTERTFEAVHRLFRLVGAATLTHRSINGSSIDIWASELMSGPRRGAPVMRVQWNRSESTIDEFQWDDPDTAMIHRVKGEVIRYLDESRELRTRVEEKLHANQNALSGADREFLSASLKGELLPNGKR